jgi:DNA-binding transcriptional regulator YiaG
MPIVTNESIGPAINSRNNLPTPMPGLDHHPWRPGLAGCPSKGTQPATDWHAVMTDAPTVAAFIRRVRTQAGLSQADLAGVVGVNQTAVSQWERGTTQPFGGHLFLILVRLAPISITVLTDYIDQLHP